MSGEDTGKANGAGQVEAGAAEVFSEDSGQNAEWNGTLERVVKREEVARGEPNIDERPRDGEYTAAETDEMYDQGIENERREREAEDEERERIRRGAAVFKGFAPANVTAMSRGRHYARDGEEADGSGTVLIGDGEPSSQEPVGDGGQELGGADGVVVLGSSSDVEPESLSAASGGEVVAGGPGESVVDAPAGGSVPVVEGIDGGERNGNSEEDVDPGDGFNDASGVVPGGDGEPVAGTEGVAPVEARVTGVSEAEGVNDNAVGEQDGIVAVVVEGVDDDGTEKAEAGGESEEAVGQNSGAVESLESRALDVAVERPDPQGAVGGDKASPEVVGLKLVGVGKAGEDRLVAAIDALPGKVVEAVEGRIKGLRREGPVRVEGMVGLETNVEGVSTGVARLDGQVKGVAKVLVEMIPEIRGMFRGELDPLSTTLLSSVEELKAELPKIEGGEAVKMEEAAEAVGKAGKAISAELVGYRADFEEWRERQRDRRKWVLTAVGVVGTPALVALGIFVQLQFGVVAIADPSNGWKDIVWSAYGREVAVCMRDARRSGSAVKCPLKVAP